jgi:hypothetical protein
MCSWPRLRGALVAAALLFPACGGGEPAEEGAEATPGAEAAPAESADMVALREKFDPFQDFAAAQAAGYNSAITPCWYHRENGGQGLHYGRTDLIDGTVTALEPELVMYEPQADGSLQLLAVEYIVPFAQWTSETPPTVMGESLHRNEALELWVHHVWLWRENPSGMHADWNPNVTCEHATESEDRADA